MSSFKDVLESNKSSSNVWIDRLMGLSREESRKFFRNNKLISKLEYDIRQFRELIRASDRIALSYTNVKLTISDVNNVGNIISSSVNNQAIYIGGFDNRFSILFQLLEKRISKREEFIQCINSYNDIVLTFLDLKRDEFYRYLELKTISEVESPPTYIEKYQPKRVISNIINKFLIKNDSPLNLQCSIHSKTNEKSNCEDVKMVNSRASIVFSGTKQFYDLLIVDKSNDGKETSSIMKTIKTGYSYKIILNRQRKLVLISD